MRTPFESLASRVGQPCVTPPEEFDRIFQILIHGIGVLSWFPVVAVPVLDRVRGSCLRKTQRFLLHFLCGLIQVVPERCRSPAESLLCGVVRLCVLAVGPLQKYEHGAAGRVDAGGWPESPFAPRKVGIRGWHVSRSETRLWSERLSAGKGCLHRKLFGAGCERSRGKALCWCLSTSTLAASLRVCCPPHPRPLSPVPGARGD